MNRKPELFKGNKEEYLKHSKQPCENKYKHHLIFDAEKYFMQLDIDKDGRLSF